MTSPHITHQRSKRLCKTASALHGQGRQKATEDTSLYMGKISSVKEVNPVLIFLLLFCEETSHSVAHRWSGTQGNTPDCL